MSESSTFSADDVMIMLWLDLRSIIDTKYCHKSEFFELSVRSHLLSWILLVYHGPIVFETCVWGTLHPD